MKTFQEFAEICEGYGYNRRGPRPVRGKDYEDYKNMPPAADFSKLQAPLTPAKKRDPKAEKQADTRRRMDAAGKKLGLGEEYVDEAGDWWHPDPKKDAAISGSGNKMRSRENMGHDTSAQTKPDYSKKLKPGETYMQFAKRKSGNTSVSNQVAKPSLKDRVKNKLGRVIDKVGGIK